MNPDKICLNSVNKLFKYEKMPREIDSIDDIKILKNYTKSYIKLYFNQQEVISEL